MDPNLVARAQHGDQQAFEALAAAAHPRLHRIALGVLQDTHTAEVAALILVGTASDRESPAGK